MHPEPQRHARSRSLDTMPAGYLNTEQAADHLTLSPRTLEKKRIIGGGPKFRKFGRRVAYALADLNAWADAHTYGATSDVEYAKHHAGDYRDRP